MKIEIELQDLIDAIRQGSPKAEHPASNFMVGDYVIVRCRDAGVHAGILVSKHGRSCILSDSRRLWYWKPSNGASFLSGVAMEGLDSSSKVGTRITVELTENCEIIKCSVKAQQSIQSQEDYKP